MAQVEKPDKLVHRHEFLVIARIPAQQGQEVDDSLGQIAGLPIAGRDFARLGVMPLQGEYRETEAVAVALAQFSVTLRLQQQRQMGKGRHRIFPTERPVEQHMQRSGRQPLLATDDVRNFHQMVVHDVGQVIGREFVGRLVKDLVIQNGGINDHIATDQVGHMHVFVRLNLETHYILRPRAEQSIHLLLGQRQRIAHLHTRGGIILEVGNLLALGLQLLRRIKGQVSLVRIQQFLHILLINIAAFGLTIGTVISAEADSFVKPDAQPLERLQDILLRARNKTVAVRIFNTENQIATMLAGKEIIIQRSTHTTDVQGTRRTGCETYSDPSFCHSYLSLFLSFTYLVGKITPFFPYY